VAPLYKSTSLVPIATCSAYQLTVLLSAALSSHTQVRSFDFSPELTRDKRGSRLLLALHNNSLELWSVTAAVDKASRRSSSRKSSADAAGDSTAATAAAAAVEGEESKVEKLAALDSHGHRSDVRAVAISGDDQLLASVGRGEAKVSSCYRRYCLCNAQQCNCSCSVMAAVQWLCVSAHCIVTITAVALASMSSTSSSRRAA
jgi:WD40 repeat protein